MRLDAVVAQLEGAEANIVLKMTWRSTDPLDAPHYQVVSALRDGGYVAETREPLAGEAGVEILRSEPTDAAASALSYFDRGRGVGLFRMGAYDSIEILSIVEPPEGARCARKVAIRTTLEDPTPVADAVFAVVDKDEYDVELCYVQEGDDGWKVAFLKWMPGI